MKHVKVKLYQGSTEKTPTLVDTRGEKPYSILANRGEMPYTNFSGRGEKPYNHKSSLSIIQKFI